MDGKNSLPVVPESELSDLVHTDLMLESAGRYLAEFEELLMENVSTLYINFSTLTQRITKYIQKNQDNEQLKRATRIIDHYYDPSKYPLAIKGAIMIIDDSAVGIETHLDPGKLYYEVVELGNKTKVKIKPGSKGAIKPVDSYFYLIKQADSLEKAIQSFIDFKMYEHNDCFNTSKLCLPVKSKTDKFLSLIEPVIGPDLAYLFTEILNPAIKNNNKKAKEIKDCLIEKNITDLIYWQKTSHRAKPVPSTVPSQVLELYKNNLISAIANSNNLTNLKQGFSALELSIFQKSLSVLDTYLKLNRRTVVRNLDNSCGNSGIEMGIMHPSEGEILANNDKEINKEFIKKFYYHWDLGFRNGHFLEDLISFTDSYEANLTEKEKKEAYEQFMANRFFIGNVAEKYKLDYHLVGFIRNMRKRDLIITLYSKRNEQMYAVGSRTEEERNKKREDYLIKAEHYHNQAIRNIKEAYTHTLSTYFACPEIVKDDYSMLVTIEADVAKNGLNEENSKKFKAFFDTIKQKTESWSMQKKCYNIVSDLGRISYLKHAIIKADGKNFDGICYDKLMNFNG